MNKKLKKGENLTENSEEEEGSENEAFVEIDEYEEEEEEDDDITEENFERKDDLNLRNTLQNLLQRAASDSKFSKLVKMDSEESSLSQKQSFGQDCTGGDVELFKMLLKQGRSIHDASDDGESLLSMAASSGYYDLCKILLAMNTDVEDRGRKGDCSPLMEASCAGYEDIIRLFIEHGAKVNARSASGNTALHYASCNGHEEAVRLLIEAGADVEVHNDNGHTPLMEAASSGKLNVAKILLESGAGINTHSNEFKETALTLACYKGHLELVKYLLQCGADHKHKTDEMHTALMEASMDGHVEVARLLLDNGAQVNMPSDSYESPLTLAACGGHMELASLLLERKANVEEANDEGYTPLMEAAREGHEDMCALLLAHAADINAQTEETQETPLTLACCGGFLEVADFLIKSGADIELGCSTPLMEASQEGHLDLVKYLLNCGANVHAKAQTGDTSFTLACENGHTDVAEVLLIDGSDLEHEAEGGRTALMKAARSGHLCTVQFLINQGADVNKTTSNNDQTVLSSACVGGHLQVVDLLLKNNANVAHVLKDGSTMLIEAAKGGHTPVVKLLFDWVSKLEHLSSEALSPASPTQSTHDLCIPRVSNHEHLNNYRKITNLNNTFINNNLSNNIFNNNNLLNNHNLLNTLNINNLNNNILNANINNNNNNNNCNSFLNNTLLNNTIVNTKHINITTLTTTTTPSNKSTNVVTKIIPKNTGCSEIIPTFSQHPPSSICCNNGLSEVAGQQALSLPSHIAPFTSLDSAGVSEEFKITLEKNNSLSSDTERKSPNKKDSNKQPTPTSPSPPLSTSLQNHLKKFNETSAAPIQTSSKQTSTTLTDSTINRTCSNIALNTQSPKLTFSSQDTVISPSKNKLMKMQPAEPSKTSSTSLLTLSTSTSSVASSNFTFCKNITDKLCAAPCEGDHESKKEDVLKNTGELDFNTILFLAELNLSQQQHQQSVLFDENKDKNNNIFSDFSNTSLSCYPETQMMQHDYQQQATDSNNKLWQQQFEQMLHWQQQQQLVTQQFLQQQQLKQQQHMAQQLQKQRLQLMQQEQLQKSQEIQNFKINKVKSNKSLSGEVDEVKETYKNLSEKLSKVAIKETVRQSDIYQEAIKSQEKEEPKSEEALKPESSSASLPPTTTTTASSSNNKESTASANITAKCNCIDAPTTKLSSLSTSTTSTSIAIPTTSTIPITTSILATSISSTTDSNTTISTTIVFTTSIQKTSIPTTTTVTVKESNKKKCCEMENDGPYKSTSDNTSPSTSKSTSGRIFVRGHRKLPALQQKQQQQLVAALSGSGGYDPCLQQINSQYCHPQLQQHLAQLAQQNSKLNILQNPSFFLNNINNNVKKGEESNEVSGETVQDTNSLSFWPQSFANTVDNSLLLQMQRQQQEQQQIKQVAPCDLNNEASNLPVTSYLPYQPSPLDLQALQCNMQQQLFLNQESLKNQQSYQFQDAQLQQLLQQQHLQTTQIKENDNNQPVVYSSNSHQAVQNSVLFQKQVEHFQQVLQQQHYNSSNNDLLNSCGQYLGQFSENQFTKYLSNNSDNVLQSSQTLLTPQQQQMIQHQLNMQQQQLIPCNNSLNNFKPSFLLQSSPLSPPDPCHFEASQSVTRCPSLDVDAQTEGNHDTALTLACAGGHTELVELLLKFNANIEHRDKKGFTPLILAAAGGHLTVVTLLLSHNADIEVQSERTKDTALSLACSSGKFDVVDELLLNGANIEHRNASDYTPLSLAASAGYNEIILLLIDHGAEINSRTGSKLGISPLMLAAMSGYVNTVTLLLDNGADINAQIETNRNTALTLACFQGRHEVVSVLVDRKANIEHRAKTGLTPLMEAASGGYVEVGKVLLNKGADVNAAPVPSSRDTALTIAADKGHHRFVELLLSRKAAVDVKNKKGCSPLWLACNGGHLEVVQHLVNAKADVDSQDNRKVSCLMAAFKKGHIKVVKWLVKHVVQFPLKQDCMRILSTITDKELLKWCQVCMEAIDGARANQAAEANRNANNLLLELDREKVQEESRKAAAARKREKKKQKKKKKMEVDGKDESNDEGKHEQGGDDNADDNSNSENDEKKVKDVIRVQPVEAANLVDTTQVAETKKAEKSKKKKKESKRPSSSAMDTKTVDANANSKDETDKNQVKRNCSKFDTNRSNQSQDNKTLISKSEISKLISSSCTTGIGDLDDFGMPTTSETVKPAKNKVTTSHSFKIKAATTTATVEASTFNNFVKSSKAHTSLKGSVLSPKKILKKEEAWKEVRGKCRKLTVPGKAVSRIIGRGGCNINAIREASAAHIDLDKVKNSSDGLVTIKGSVESAKFACDLIEALVREPDKDIETLINLFNKSNYDPTVNAPSNTFNPILTETIISEDKHSSSHAYNGFTNNANHNPQKSTTVFKSTIKKTTPNTIDKSNNEKNDEYKKNIFPPYFGNDSRSNDNTGFSMATHTSKSYNHYGDGHTEVVKNRNTTYNKSRSDNYITSTNNNFIPSKSVSILNSNASTDAWNKPKILTTTAKAVLKTQIPPSSTSSFSSLKTTAKISSSSSSIINNESSFFSNNSFVWDKNTKASVASQKIEPIPSFANESWHPLNAANQLKLNAKGTDNDPDSNFTIASTSSNSLTISTNLGSLISNSKSDKKEHLSPWLQPSNNTSQPSVVEPAFPANAPNREYSPFKTFFSSSNLINNDKIRMSFSSSVLGGIPNNSLTTTTHNSDVLIDSSLQAKAPGYRPPILNSSPRKTVPDADSKKPNTFDNTDQNIPFFPKVSSEASDEKNSNSNKPLDNALFMQPNPIDFNMSNQRNQYASTKTPMTLPLLDSNLNPNAPTFPVNPPFDFNTKPITSFNPQTQQFPIMKGAVPNYSHTKSAYNLFTNVAQNNPSFLQQMPMSQTFVQLPSKDFSKNKPIDPLQSTDTSYETGVLNDSTPASSGPSSPNNDDKKSIQPIGGELRSKKQRISAPINNISTMQAPPHSFNNIPYMQPNFNQQWTTSYQASEGGSDWRSTFIPSDHRAPYINTASHELLRNPDPIRPSPFDPRIQTPQLSMGATHANVPTFSNGFMAQYLPGMMRGAGDSWEPVHRLKMHPSITAWNNPGWQQSHNF